MPKISKNAEHIKVDKKDEKILALLSENSRMAATEIARKTRLSKDSVNYRIRRLQNTGVIRRFFPEVDYAKLGYHIYHVFLVIDEADKAKYGLLIASLKAHRNTIRVVEYSAMWDVEWTLIAEHAEEFEMALAEASAGFYGIILERSNYFVTNVLRMRTVPFSTGKLAMPKKDEYLPDAKDIAIIRALSENCRASTYSLSEKVGLSADAIGLRMKRLLKSGVILRYAMLPDVSMLGFSEYAFCMQLKLLTEKSRLRLRGLVEMRPSIISALNVFGEWDAIIYLLAREASDLHREVKEIKTTFSEIIKSYCVLNACEEHVFNPLPPLVGLKPINRALAIKRL
jgi:DNA-binding Lrp family transcriptional regulator